MKRLILLLMMTVALCAGCAEKYHLSTYFTQDVPVHREGLSYIAKVEGGGDVKLFELNPKMKQDTRSQEKNLFKIAGAPKPNKFRIWYNKKADIADVPSPLEDFRFMANEFRKAYKDEYRLVGIEEIKSNIFAMTYFNTSENTPSAWGIFTGLLAYKNLEEGLLEVDILAYDELPNLSLLEEARSMDHPFVKAFNQRVLDSVIFFPED